MSEVLTRENVARLREVLADLSPTHRLTPQRLSFLDNPAGDVDVQNLYLETTLGPVDILSSIKGVGDYARVREGSIMQRSPVSELHYRVSSGVCSKPATDRAGRTSE